MHTTTTVLCDCRQQRASTDRWIHTLCTCNRLFIYTLCTCNRLYVHAIDSYSILQQIIQISFCCDGWARIRCGLYDSWVQRLTFGSWERREQNPSTGQPACKFVDHGTPLHFTSTSVAPLCGKERSTIVLHAGHWKTYDSSIGIIVGRKKDLCVVVT